MNVKQTLKVSAIALLLIGGIVSFVAPAAMAAECGGYTTSVINCDQTGGTTIQETGAWGILLLAINILTAGIGIVAVGGIVYAAILYSSAGGNAEQTKKAMTIITDIVIGVVAYALMYAALNFLVPGGIFT
jgi:hypothetical protein